MVERLKKIAAIKKVSRILAQIKRDADKLEAKLKGFKSNDYTRR